MSTLSNTVTPAATHAESKTTTSQSSCNHSTVKIGISSSGDTTFTHLLPSRHSRTELTKLLQSFLSRKTGNWTMKQTESVERFHIVTYLQSLKSEEDVVENEELLVEYFDIFDKLFFNGALKGLCKVEFSKDSNLVPDLTWGHWVTSPRDHDPQNDSTNGCLAAIHIRDMSKYSMDPSWGCDRKQRLSIYLAELLHEMVHVFFGIYSRPCSECQADSNESGYCGRDKNESCALCKELGVEDAAWQFLGEGLFMSWYMKSWSAKLEDEGRFHWKPVRVVEKREINKRSMVLKAGFF